MKNDAQNFTYFLSSYFRTHLPLHTGYSDNTITSYRDTFVLLLEYIEKISGKSGSQIEFDNITKQGILDFLDYLENERNASVSTRNQRLSAIRAFFHYVEENSINQLYLCNQIFTIHKKKVPQTSVEYLSTEALKSLFESIDISSKKGMRDLALLTLLYDLGARVQELIDLKMNDIHEDGIVKLCGKGNKIRQVMLCDKSHAILKQYVKKLSLGDTVNDHPVFFNSRKTPLTRAGVAYILNKYYELAKAENPQLYPPKISPHSLRHSKAMHLVQGGVNLIYIRDLFGHASITTTEVYAKADANAKKDVINLISSKIVPDSKFSKEKEEDLLSYLKGL